MQIPNQKTKSVRVHDFAMNPSSDVPRSQFDLSHRRAVPFSFSNLIPILAEPVLPGDTWNCRISVSARTAVPLVPLQENWKMEFFSFFVPMRLVWANARKFWGEQDNPGDSIAYTMPTCTSPVGGYAISSLQDYFGLPTVGQIGGANTLTHVNLIPRCYNQIYQEWFRDENLQAGVNIGTGDGPDSPTSFVLRKRGKRFDYITQALPWPQKGNTAISIPLGTVAPVRTQAGTALVSGAQAGIQWKDGLSGASLLGNQMMMTTNAAANNPNMRVSTTAATAGAGDFLYPANLYADLTTATAATINALRTAITMQQYLEKDARGGTRYTEYVYNMFKVRTADARLNRPEFIGSGFAAINTVAIPQTSATGLTGGTTPAGSLAASGYASGGGGFTYSATEHGYVLTIVCATADLTYSQGLRKHWSVSTRYDWPVPLLANLGEQALLNKEVFCDGSAADNNVFGYIPRWDEWRFIPSQVVGIYRPYAPSNIAYWNSSQLFASLPTLNDTFITDASDVVTQRNFSAGAASANQQILGDFFFNIKVARALPLYGIPGLTRL